MSEQFKLKTEVNVLNVLKCMIILKHPEQNVVNHLLPTNKDSSD